MYRNLLFAMITITGWGMIAPTARAGEISGLPPHLAPTTQPDYSLFLGNDFLVPGTNDDFRTQQMIATARFGKRWVAVLDESILTREYAVTGPPARIDLMALSLGYELLNNTSVDERTALTIGTGMRAVGNFGGSRIQNGFHALVASNISTIPYATTRQSDLTAWVLGEHHQIVRQASGNGLLSGWDTGYWGRVGALATADGQFDAVAGLYLIATRPGFDVWFGLRQDWREGYDADIVQVETAAEESKTALSYGVRLGALVIETVQRFDSSASYGQISFVSSAATRRSPIAQPPRLDVQLGMYMPQMMFQLAGRWHHRLFTSGASGWRESMVVDLRGGQPQLGSDFTRFVDTLQLSAGLEFSRQLVDNPDWLRFYGGAAVGWRNEQLIGRGDLAGIRSESVGRAVLQADIGLEIDTVRIRSNWRHKLRFGLSGWLPSSGATVNAGGLVSELQRPGASVAIMWIFNHY